MDFKDIVGFFSPCAFAGHLLTKVSVEKMYYVICSILQALLLMVQSPKIALLRDSALFFRALFGNS